MYQLIINKIEPLSDEEKEARNMRSSKFYPNDMPIQDSKITKSLDVQITEEEFQTIKRAALQIM